MSGTTELLLQNARSGALHHALILHGATPELLEKTALSIARVLNCATGSGSDDCLSCSRIDRRTHPDLHLIEVAEDRSLISVEQIRALVAAASLRSYEGGWKTFIVEQAEAMSAGGANALLKTLEEPGQNTLFLLLTRSPDLLLPTIRSRCQSILIRPEARRSALELAEQEGLSLQEARLSLMFPSLEPATITETVSAIIGAVDTAGSEKNAAVLLELAAMLSASDQPGDQLALFAAVMRDLASAGPESSLLPERHRSIQQVFTAATLLRVSEMALQGIGRLAVHVDSRLLFERALAQLLKKTAPV
jgi:DNA polymerase III delta prime subunit